MKKVLQKIIFYVIIPHVRLGARRGRLVGRGRATGNRVNRKTVSRVRIPLSPNGKRSHKVGSFFRSESIRKGFEWEACQQTVRGTVFPPPRPSDREFFAFSEKRARGSATRIPLLLPCRSSLLKMQYPFSPHQSPPVTASPQGEASSASQYQPAQNAVTSFKNVTYNLFSKFFKKCDQSGFFAGIRVKGLSVGKEVNLG